jgi:uridine kinase
MSGNVRHSHSQRMTQTRLRSGNLTKFRQISARHDVRHSQKIQSNLQKSKKQLRQVTHKFRSSTNPNLKFESSPVRVAKVKRNKTFLPAISTHSGKTNLTRSTRDTFNKIMSSKNRFFRDSDRSNSSKRKGFVINSKVDTPKNLSSFKRNFI